MVLPALNHRVNEVDGRGCVTCTACFIKDRRMSSCSSSFDKRESHNFSMTGKWVFILTTLLRSSWGFNVDLKNVINAHGPSADVLFGYSLALNPKGSLYVGAPEHNQDGAILRCDFDGRRVDGEQSFCSIIDLPRQVNSAGEVNRYIQIMVINKLK